MPHLEPKPQKADCAVKICAKYPMTVLGMPFHVLAIPACSAVLMDRGEDPANRSLFCPPSTALWSLLQRLRKLSRNRTMPRDHLGRMRSSESHKP